MKTWTKEEIKNLISTNDEMVKRSLIQLYNQQTSQEKISGRTIEYNKRGFNGIDDDILTNISEFYLKKNYLSPKQLELVRKKIIKYAGQLTSLANEYELSKCN